MDIINRVKQILVSPKIEWLTIEAENEPHVKVFTNYVVPLALIPAIAAFIGYGLIGYTVLGVHVGSISWGIRSAIMQYILMLGGTYVTSFIINALAENFGARKDLNQAFSLVAFAYTPMFIAGICYILPSLSWIALFAGLYSLYLLYIGLQPMMKVSAEKQTTYFVISLIVLIVVWAVLSMILSAILLPSAFAANGFSFK